MDQVLVRHGEKCKRYVNKCDNYKVFQAGYVKQKNRGVVISIRSNRKGGL